MRSKLTAQEVMFSKIREWQESGMNQKSFCIQQNIAYHRFHHYYKKFREGDCHTSPGLVPLQISDTDSDVFALLTFANGHTIQFHQTVSADYLKALVG